MKKYVASISYKTLLFSVLTFFISLFTFAQDSATSTTTSVTTSTEEWQSNPVYWIGGAITLIIIVALIASRGRRRDA